MSKISKLPFKNYGVLPVSLIQNHVFGTADIYRVFILSLTADKTSGKTDTTINQLADLVGESSNNYKNKNSFTDKLRESGEVTVETLSIQGTQTSSPIKRNYYTFRPLNTKEPFRMIGKEFHSIDADIKIKGYLIKLYSAANTNSLFLNKPKSELEKTLHISHDTINKYNKVLEEKGLIEMVEKGLFITCPGIKPITIITEKTKEILSANQENLISAIALYNQTHPDKIDLKSLTNQDLMKLPIDKTTRIFATYYLTKFKTIENINGFALYLVTGLSSKTAKYEEKALVEIVL